MYLNFVSNSHALFQGATASRDSVSLHRLSFSAHPAHRKKVLKKPLI